MIGVTDDDSSKLNEACSRFAEDPEVPRPLFEVARRASQNQSWSPHVAAPDRAGEEGRRGRSDKIL